MRAPKSVRHQRRLPRAGRLAICVAERERRWREEERPGGDAVRGRNPHPREAAKARDETPYSSDREPPPLSSGSALDWPRPLPHSPPLIGCRSRPSSMSPTPLAPLPRYPLPEFFIGAGHTLSFVTGLRLLSGPLPSHLSFILDVVLGAWDMGVNQTRPCPQGVKGKVGGHRPRLRQ